MKYYFMLPIQNRKKKPSQELFKQMKIQLIKYTFLFSLCISSLSSKLYVF